MARKINKAGAYDEKEHDEENPDETGATIIFDREEDYKKFIEQLKQDGKVIKNNSFPTLHEKESSNMNYNYKSLGFVVFILIFVIASGVIGSIFTDFLQQLVSFF